MARVRPADADDPRLAGCHVGGQPDRTGRHARVPVPAKVAREAYFLRGPEVRRVWVLVAHGGVVPSVRTRSR